MSADIRARLDAITARAEAATPGPWSAWRRSGDPGAGWQEVTLLTGHPDVAITVEADDNADPTADFIAHARQDLPALLAFARDVLDLHRPERPTGNLVTDATPSYCGGCYEAGGYDGAPLWVDCPVVALATRHLGGEA